MSRAPDKDRPRPRLTGDDLVMLRGDEIRTIISMFSIKFSNIVKKSLTAVRNVKGGESRGEDLL